MIHLNCIFYVINIDVLWYAVGCHIDTPNSRIYK